MDILWATDTKPKGHVLKSCRLFVKNCQDTKKWVNEIATIVCLKTSLQLFIFSIMSIVLVQWYVIFWDNQWNTSD